MSFHLGHQNLSVSLRSAAVLAFAAVAALVMLAASPATPGASAAQCKKSSVPAQDMAAKRASKATLCLLNKERGKRGMGKLKAHKAQKKAAKKHTRAMLQKGCFAHLCPGEKDLVGRILSTSYLPCACTWGVGENIAYGYGAQASPRMIVKAWMNSPGHRANILNRSFEHIGIGIKRGVPGGGGDGATYTTTFGFRN